MKLLDIVNKVLDSNGLPPVTSLNTDMNLRDDLGFDSFMLAELTVEIEEIYKVDIFTNGLVFTVKDIESRLNG
jgi:acyl carrier protein